MPASTPRIAMLCAAAERHEQGGVDYFVQLDDLLQASFDVLLLDLPAVQAGQALRSLRQVGAYHFSLIYCCQDQDAWCEALGDGPAPADLELLMPLWRLWQERLSLFNRGLPAQRFETRVLTWMWLHPRRGIRALRDATSPQHYRYPLLEALAGGEQVSAFVWLRMAVEQGWLLEGELLDRLRLCTGCGSGRLNYVDVCPECHLLEIARQPSLHCFTCGHVGPQERFLKDGLLLCPNCLSRLRHIGSDYDRPLENYRCRSCQAFFVDAAVEARCLDCNQVHSPDRLRVREVRHYLLSEIGRLRCRQGTDASVRGGGYFDRQGLVGIPLFIELLEWQIQLVRRYGEPGFSLFGLRFANLPETFAQLGELRGYAVLDGLVERLHRVIGDTDRCTRSSEEQLWVLLPRTAAEAVAGLRERWLTRAALLQEDEVVPLQLQVISFTAPQELEAQESAELLLARLAGQMR